jgi:hypothetical protein
LAEDSAPQARAVITLSASAANSPQRELLHFIGRKTFASALASALDVP